MKRFTAILAILLLGACASDQTQTQTQTAPEPAAEEAANNASSTMGATTQQGSGGLGATSGNLSSGSEKIFNSNERMVFGELELTINGTKPNTIRRGGDGAPPEQTATMVSITAVNTGGPAKTLQPSMFRLKGENGAIYTPSDQGGKLFNLPKFPVFDGVELQPKGSSIITLVFEIPQENVFDLLFNWGGKETTVRLGMEW